VLLDHQDESPFLGDIEPGKSVQALDNNLFRAPMVKHAPAETDFLLIKVITSNTHGLISQNGRRMIIREIPSLYVVGQIQPKMEIYAPNSRAANAYIKNRLQGYIYRLFMKKSVNHRLKISDIMTLFPGNSETSIRKRLKDCADFQRGGDDSGWWTVKGKKLFQLENFFLFPTNST
jgi:transcription initiation factor TFIID subunit 1